MVGMMMLTFILFFAFVINTGMLVNAKINLQNAADMAAYSGAAVQARQLNQISYLNYEMRRQYKKFLFRYYVMGNMAQDSFPRSGGGGAGTTAATWQPDRTNPGVSYGGPVVCMIFNSGDNYCHLSKLAKIEIPPPNPLDSIAQTLIEQLTAIENIRQQNCRSIGITNTTLLRLWLWNTDPELLNLAANLPNGELQKSLNTIRGLALGLGLIPRELLLRARIETLRGYVNQPPQKSLTYQTVSQMAQSEDPPASERTQQAFLSAFYTLGEHTFASGDVTMDELTPESLLVLKDVKINFDAYALDFTMGGGLNPTTGAVDCTPVVQVDKVLEKFPIAVYKDPSILTYYAVRLKSKAPILFSPFGDVTLKAYSAAQPFGSRIGPELTENDFIRPMENTGTLSTAPGINSITLHHKIPNLTIRAESDNAGVGKGWDTQEALSAFYQGFRAAGGTQTLSLGQAEVQAGINTAMVPNPFEGNKYNIVNDLGDSFVHNFDTRGVTAFWAPVFPPSKASQADSEIQSLVQGLIGDSRESSAEFKASLTKELTTYIGKLRKGQGEPIGGAAEAFNIAYIEDSLHLPGQAKPISVPGGLSETDPAKIKTSWNGVLNGAFRKDGRVGYSVKFVSFPSLVGHTSKTNGSSNWNNSLNTDEEGNQDITIIQH